MPKMLQLGTEYKAHSKSQESGSLPFQGSIFLPVKDIMCFPSVGTPENPDNHPVLAKYSKRLTNLMHYIHDPNMWIFFPFDTSLLHQSQPWWPKGSDEHTQKGPGPCQGQTEVKPGSADGKCKAKHSIHSAVNASPTA